MAQYNSSFNNDPYSYKGKESFFTGGRQDMYNNPYATLGYPEPSKISTNNSNRDNFEDNNEQYNKGNRKREYNVKDIAHGDFPRNVPKFTEEAFQSFVNTDEYQRVKRQSNQIFGKNNNQQQETKKIISRWSSRWSRLLL